LKGHRQIGYIDDLLYDQNLKFMDDFFPGLKARFRSTTVIAQMNAVAAGAGIGIITCFMAAAGQP
jgi:DNA-binding transcriptional LysR family regulator